jgi:hypothetical protein
MNIDVWEVIDAAKTKPFYPGSGRLLLHFDRPVLPVVEGEAVRLRSARAIPPNSDLRPD